MMPTLPFELVEDILCRLPVKSLKRFRCVAKPWCSLIDNDRFIKSHLQRSLATKSHHHYILQVPDGVLSIHFDSPNKAQVVNLIFPFDSADGFSNTCNGLVLIRCKPPVLWNPFTRDYKVLPDECMPTLESFSTVVYGLAYDSRNDDYKVVRVVEHRRSVLSSTWITSQADMYSLKSDSWKRLENFPYPLPYFREDWRPHINGVLHTIIDRDDPIKGSIKTFSVETEKHSELEMPDIVQEKGWNLTLHKVGGCLSVVCIIESRVEFWVMKDYGVTGSWTRILARSAESFHSLDIVMHSDDVSKVMVYPAFPCWFDLGNGTLDVIDIPASVSRYVHYGDTSVESLVLLGGDKEANARRKTMEKKMRGRKRDDFLSVGFKLVL